MAGDVDDVVHPTHDVDVTVRVLVARVAGQIVAGMLREIGLLVSGVVVPQGRQASRGQRQADGHRADLARGHLLVVLTEHTDVVARHRLRGRARLHRQHAEADAVRRDGPRRFRLPPVIDHGHVEPILGPVERVGVAALAGEEQGAESREVVLRHVRPSRVFLLDRAKRRRRREERVHAVVGDDAPERAGIRRAHRLAFVEDRGAALQQRRVDDVRVADDPADVRGGPERFPGSHTIDGVHRPLERDGVTAVVVHDPLGDSRGARRVQDVERIRGEDRHAVDGGRGGQRLVPVEIAPADHRRGLLRPL